MTRRIVGAILAAGALATPSLTACSSGSHHVTTPTTSSTPTPTASKAGGLINIIDRARISAVCANAHAAQEVLSVGGSTVTDPLVADAGLLERPPVDPKAAADAAAIRRDLRQGHVDAALKVALAYCSR